MKINTNTAIKVVGGVSARDARAFAGQIGADPELILSQPTGSFATYIRGLTKRAVPMSFPFFVMEKLLRTSHEERDAIRAKSRATYAEPIDPGPSQAHEPGASELIDAEPVDDDDPLKPSPEL